MAALNRRAQVFLIFVCLLGLAAALAATRLPVSGGWELGVFLLLGLLTGRTKVRLTPPRTSQRTADAIGTLSLTFALIFAALLRLGPGAAMLVGSLSTLSSCLYPKRQALHRVAFNLALNAAGTYTAGRVFGDLHGGLRDASLLAQFGAVMASCLSFFLINTVAVAAILSLTTGRAAWTIWRETLLWTAPSYFAAGSAGELAALLLGPHFGAICLFVGPVAAATYLAYALSRRRSDENQERIDQLQAQEAQLADALRHEHLIAETLQRSLLSAPDAQTFAGLDIHTEYEPAWSEALIGGDFYDTLPLTGGRVALVVGDVAGKGLAAARHTAEVKYALRAILHDCPDSGAALARLNDYLLQSRKARPGADSVLVAVALAVVDTRTGEALVSLAGAEPPLLLRAAGEAEEVTAGGMLLGVMPGEVYEVRRLQLACGDSLLMVTDGITEARCGAAFFGHDGLRQAARRVLARPALAQDSQPAAIPAGQAIIAEARRFTGGFLHDDVCLLLVRRTPAPPPCLPAPLVYSTGEQSLGEVPGISFETADAPRCPDAHTARLCTFQSPGSRT